MSETTIPNYEKYKENVGSFFEAASNADCVPKNLAKFWEQLLSILKTILKKSDDKLSSEEMLIEVFCRNPWSYWSSWTTSSFGVAPQPTYPIKTFIGNLEKLVKNIE